MKYTACAKVVALSNPRKPQAARNLAGRSKRLRTSGYIVTVPQLFSKQRAKVIPLARPGAVESGMKEQLWIQSHWREYLGRWVALDGDRLISDAASARLALEEAMALGVQSPFLMRVTEPSELPFGGW